MYPHATCQCGLLWTLTPDGQQWLQQRRTAKANNDQARMNLADAILRMCHYNADEVGQEVHMIYKSHTGRVERRRGNQLVGVSARPDASFYC